MGSPPNRVHEIAQNPYGIRILSHFVSNCYESFTAASAMGAPDDLPGTGHLCKLNKTDYQRGCIAIAWQGSMWVGLMGLKAYIRECVEKINTKATGEVKHAGFNRKTPSLRWRGVVKDITFRVPPSLSEAIWLFHPLLMRF